MHPALPLRLSPTRPRLALATNARLYMLALVTLTWVGFALRLGLLSAFPLREDEAIYGYWARAAMVDPFFLHIWPDKPPLFIWLLTGTFALLGASEASARLVSIFASTLTIPVVALAAQRLWRSRKAAWLAALLLVFNPFAVSFAPTAYTDSLLGLFGTGALVAALSGRGFGAGLLLAAACMTKQQGVFYVPLVVMLLLCAPFDAALSFRAQRGIPSAGQPSGGGSEESATRDDNATLQSWAKLGWALLGAAIIILPILWWDSQRWAVAPSPWALAQSTYAPLSWLPPQQWPARWQEWAKLLWYLGGSWTVWAMLGAAMGVAVGMACRHLRLALILGWGVCFLLLHLITSVQVWDRYLLPLAPWLALIASGPLALVVHRRLPGWSRGLLFLLLVMGLAESVLPGVAAARGQLPIGGDHGDYAGLTEAVAWVQGQCQPPEAKAIRLQNDAPERGLAPHSLPGSSGIPGRLTKGLGCPAILYHQMLGWHFRFYLYDELQPVGDNPPRFDLRWFPSATYLADNAAKSPYPPKYLIVPDWATPRDLALHLALRGLALEPRLHVGRFAVMEITQPPRPLCDWCKSLLPNALSPFAPHHLPVTPVPQMSTP